MNGGVSGSKRKSTMTKTVDGPLDSLFAGDDSFSAVDDLLRAVEDDLLLKLRLGAHTSSRSAASGFSAPSTSSLDPDLLRRLEALKSPPPPPSGAAASVPASAAVVVDDEWGAIIGDDLAARFAALKESSASRSSLVRDGSRSTGPMIAVSVVEKLGISKEDASEVSNEEEEVEKLLQWAIDAARLDTADSKSINDDDLDDDDADSKSNNVDDLDDDDADSISNKDDDDEEEKESRRINRAISNS